MELSRWPVMPYITKQRSKLSFVKYQIISSSGWSNWPRCRPWFSPNLGNQKRSRNSQSDTRSKLRCSIYWEVGKHFQSLLSMIEMPSFQMAYHDQGIRKDPQFSIWSIDCVVMWKTVKYDSSAFRAANKNLRRTNLPAAISFSPFFSPPLT